LKGKESAKASVVRAFYLGRKKAGRKLAVFFVVVQALAAVSLSGA
jgi:hypothetical protein